MPGTSSSKQLVANPDLFVRDFTTQPPLIENDRQKLKWQRRPSTLRQAQDRLLRRYGKPGIAP